MARSASGRSPTGGFGAAPAPFTLRRAHGGRLVTDGAAFPRGSRHPPFAHAPSSSRRDFNAWLPLAHFCEHAGPPVSAGARRGSGRGRPALPDPPSAAGTSPARSSRSQRCLLVRVSSCVCTHVPVGQVSRGGCVTRKGKRSGHTTAGPRDPAGAHLALALHGHRPLAPRGLFCGKPAKSSGGARPSGRRSEAPLCI